VSDIGGDLIPKIVAIDLDIVATFLEPITPGSEDKEPRVWLKLWE
jgi:hypothetical protein